MSTKKQSTLTPELIAKLQTMSPREQKYFRIMWPKSGVLYITAKPGIAKSAIAKTIAKKMGFAYIDQRLSMNDETDFKFPFLTDESYDGNIFKVSDTAVPKWAFDANKQPTIIHFEELNRAPTFVRNAALQILLERQIGDFKFNDNVLMMASGNLGEEDGADVEEFDSALNNRLIHISHTLSPKEWIENYAVDNIHPLVCDYISTHGEKLAQDKNENSKAYATPRSWTFLSDWIVENFGYDSSARDFIPALTEIAHGYIGAGAKRFVQYCEDMVNISIFDVINNYDGIVKELAKYNRDKKEELLQSLKGHKLGELNTAQLDNVAKFLKSISDDALTAYLIYVVEESKEVGVQTVKDFMRTHFREELIQLNDRTIAQS